MEKLVAIRYNTIDNLEMDIRTLKMRQRVKALKDVGQSDSEAADYLVRKFGLKPSYALACVENWVAEGDLGDDEFW